MLYRKPGSKAVLHKWKNRFSLNVWMKALLNLNLSASGGLLARVVVGTRLLKGPRLEDSAGAEAAAAVSDGSSGGTVVATAPKSAVPLPSCSFKPPEVSSACPNRLTRKNKHTNARVPRARSNRMRALRPLNPKDKHNSSFQIVRRGAYLSYPRFLLAVYGGGWRMGKTSLLVIKLQSCAQSSALITTEMENHLTALS